MRHVRIPVRLAVALVALMAMQGRGTAAESPSYVAYAQGQYLTALHLAEKEASEGSKEAFTLMGEIYLEGLGVAQDFEKAADAYAQAADLGDPDAEFALGEVEDHELAWYAPQEIPFLLELM